MLAGSTPLFMTPLLAILIKTSDYAIIVAVLVIIIFALDLRSVKRKLDARLKHQGVNLPSRLSPEVQLLARDPSKKIAAIKLHGEQNPGLSLADAKREVEDFEPQLNMWTHYRIWKPTVFFPLFMLALGLMRDSNKSATQYLGLGIGIVLVLDYLVEEVVVGIVQNRGRPCPDCGQRVRLRSFGVQLRCPHCGSLFPS